MALKYYFDAEDTDFPYQVVVRNSDGTYVGQCAMSASLGAYTKGSAGVSSQAQASPLNGSPLTIRFTDYDWASCSPLPSDYSTDEAIMAYLSILFTGQYGTLVPPTPTSNSMNIFQSQPLGEITAAAGADDIYYMSLNGAILNPASAAYTEEEVAARIPTNISFASQCMSAVVSDYLIDVIVVVDLMVYGAGESGVTLSLNTDGVVKSTGEYSALTGDLLYYRVTVPVGTGTLTVSPIVIAGTPTV